MMSRELKEDQLDKKLQNYIEEVKAYVKEWRNLEEKEILVSWMHKLEDAFYSTIIEKKNRNLYAQILCHVVKRGRLKEPFSATPTNEALPTIPAYMSAYLDETLVSSSFYKSKEPEWLQGEDFDDSVLSSVAVSEESYLKYKHILSPKRREKFMLSVDVFEEDSLNLHSKNSVSKKIDFHDDTEVNELKKILEFNEINRINSELFNKNENRNNELKLNPFVKGKQLTNSYAHSSISNNTRKHERRKTAKEEYEELYGNASNTTSISSSRKLTESVDSLYLQDDEKKMTIARKTTSLSREKELELKVRLLEGKVQEETLKSQQKHDQMVQKILDRKNNELNDLRDYYNKKIVDLEKQVKDYDKKVTTLNRELTFSREKYEIDINELKEALKNASTNTASHYEKMMYDKLSDYEKEIFDLQKSHRQTIHDVTEEASKKIEAVKLNSIKEKKDLETKIKKLNESLKARKNVEEKNKAEQLKEQKEREDIIDEKRKKEKELNEANNKIDQIEKEKIRITKEYEGIVKGLREKSEKAFNDMNEERNRMETSSTTLITELEAKIAEYRKTVQDMDIENNRAIQGKDAKHQDEIHQLKIEHDKKTREMKFDFDKQEMQYQSSIKRYEMKLVEKENEIKKIENRLSEYKEETDNQLDKFKQKTEEESTKIFDDLNKQLNTLQDALKVSKEKLESQRIEYTTSLSKQKGEFEQKLDSYKQSTETEKMKSSQNYRKEIEIIISKHNLELEELKEVEKSLRKDKEVKMQNQKETDGKIINELENQIRKLREEVIQANNLRKEQIKEISNLREEEKNAAKRNETAMVKQFKKEEDEMKTRLQQENSKNLNDYRVEMEKRLEELGHDYAKKSKRDLLNIENLNSQLKKLKEESEIKTISHDIKIKQLKMIKEEEKGSKNKLAQELVEQKAKYQQLEKKCTNIELICKEKISRCRLDCEEKLQGMLPITVKKELEETIECLHEQVAILESRAQLLQDELNDTKQYSLIRHGVTSSLTMKSTDSSQVE